jgi:hypothetical protein
VGGVEGQILWVELAGLPGPRMRIPIGSPAHFVQAAKRCLTIPDNEKSPWAAVWISDPVTLRGAFLDVYRYHYHKSLPPGQGTTAPAGHHYAQVPPVLGGPQAVVKIAPLGIMALPTMGDEPQPVRRVRGAGTQATSTSKTTAVLAVVSQSAPAGVSTAANLARANPAPARATAGTLIIGTADYGVILIIPGQCPQETGYVPLNRSDITCLNPPRNWHVEMQKNDAVVVEYELTTAGSTAIVPSNRTFNIGNFDFGVISISPGQEPETPGFIPLNRDDIRRLGLNPLAYWHVEMRSSDADALGYEGDDSGGMGSGESGDKVDSEDGDGGTAMVQ